MISNNRLRQVREGVGISQLELAARTRIAPGIISNLETGKLHAWPGWRRRLAAALEVEPAYLFPEEELQSEKLQEK